MQARSPLSPNISICPSLDKVHGLDVSHLQGTIDWLGVKENNMEFCFIKATEGTQFVDPLFQDNWKNAQAAGLIRGAYHFFRPSLDGNEQADQFLRTMGQLGPLDLPPVLDFEVTDRMPNVVQIQGALDFLEQVEVATRRKPIIYTGWGFYNQLKNPVDFFPYSLWIAEYSVACPHVPPPWSSWDFWQTGQSRVSGVGGMADLNIFNGTLTQLQGLVSSSLST